MQEADMDEIDAEDGSVRMKTGQAILPTQLAFKLRAAPSSVLVIRSKLIFSNYIMLFKKPMASKYYNIDCEIN
jgi:hypothetical protein